MDFAQHGRVLSGSYVREASIGSEKEEDWSYELPAVPPGKQVASVAIETGGARELFVEDGWRLTNIRPLGRSQESSNSPCVPPK